MTTGRRPGTSGPRRLPLRGIIVVIAGFLLQLSLGCLYTFGNLTTYLTSYLRVQLGEDVGYGQTLWVSTALMLCQGPAVFVGSMCYGRFGPRITILVGSIVVSGSVAVTSLSVQSSFFWTLLTYGVTNGLGVGLVYTTPMLAGYKWFPDHKGLVSGVVVGGYGLGGIIFDTIQTSFLNPDNVSPDDDGFFHDATLLSRVPRVFLLQAGVCAALQLVGLLGVRDPPAGVGEDAEAAKRVDGQMAERASESEADSREASHLELKDGQGVESPTQISWKKSLMTIKALQLMLGYVLTNFSIGIVNPLWKAFGQEFIKDDHFLELVGSVSSAFNMLGRLTWGFLCDMFGYKPVMLSISALFCALMLTLQATSEGGKVMFLLWIWAIYFCFSGIFSVVVTGTAETFGAESAGPIYGVIFTVGSLTTPLVSLTSNLLLDRYDYSVVFLEGGLVTMLGFLATLTI